MDTVEDKWGVFNERDILCSSKDGLTEEEAKQYAINWNTITNSLWYVAKMLEKK